jgi:hypothetical protein
LPGFNRDERDRIDTWKPSDEPHALGIASSPTVGANEKEPASAGTPCAPDLDMTYIEHGRRLSRRPPVNEALIAVAAGIESGVLSALPSNADLQRSALGAGGSLCK